jgi:serine/threonine kinase 32
VSRRYTASLIIRYELLFGKRPFRGRTNTALTNAILHEHLTWPDDVADKCSTSGMQAIRAVSYFSLLGEV